MDEFEQSDLEKEINDSRNTMYQIGIHYKEKDNAFIKKFKCSIFSVISFIKLDGYKTKSRFWLHFGINRCSDS